MCVLTKYIPALDPMSMTQNIRDPMMCRLLVFGALVQHSHQLMLNSAGSSKRNSTTSTAPPMLSTNTTSTAPPQLSTNTTSTAPPTWSTNTTSTAPPQLSTNTTSTAPPTWSTNTTSTAPPMLSTNTTSTAPPTWSTNTTSTAPPTWSVNTTSTASPTWSTNTTSTAPPMLSTNTTSTAPPMMSINTTSTAPPTWSTHTSTIPSTVAPPTWVTNTTPTTQATRSTQHSFPDLMRIPSSCQARCGMLQEFPCSCDVTCHVLHFCCDDVDTACPEVLTASRRLYGNVYDRRIECSVTDGFTFGFLFITTCSTGSHNETANDGAKQSFTTKVDHNLNLDYFRNSVPVTDMATGLNYINFSVFQCNAQSKSIPVKWDLFFQSKHFIQSLKNASDLSDNMDRSYLPYFLPPEELNSKVMVRCFPFAIATCSPSLATHDNQRKCSQNISFVIDVHNTFYKNRHCAICNGLNETELFFPKGITDQAVRHINQLSVLVSFNEVGIKLKSYPRRLSGKSMPWLTASCHAPEVTFDLVTLDSLSCDVDKCSPSFYKSPDGNCVMTNVLQLAVTDDGFPLSLREQSRLPGFVKCYLKRLKWEVSHSENSTEILFDARLNITLYSTKTVVKENLQFLEPSEFLLIEKPNLISMAKSFFLYRRLRFWNSREVTQKVTQEGTLENRSTDANVSKSFRSNRLTQSFFPEVTACGDSSRVALCYCTFMPSLQETSCDLSCLHVCLNISDNELEPNLCWDVLSKGHFNWSSGAITTVLISVNWVLHY